MVVGDDAGDLRPVEVRAHAATRCRLCSSVCANASTTAGSNASPPPRLEVGEGVGSKSIAGVDRSGRSSSASKTSATATMRPGSGSHRRRARADSPSRPSVRDASTRPSLRARAARCRRGCEQSWPTPSVWRSISRRSVSVRAPGLRRIAALIAILPLCRAAGSRVEHARRRRRSVRARPQSRRDSPTRSTCSPVSRSWNSIARPSRTTVSEYARRSSDSDAATSRTPVERGKRDSSSGCDASRRRRDQQVVRREGFVR